MKHAVLDGGNKIILADWPNEKDLECNKNNDTPAKIPHFSYVLLNRRVLCNCDIKLKINFF